MFDFVPDRVFVTVPADYNLAKAAEEVDRLNPGLQFEKVKLDYIDIADQEGNRQTQELRIVYMPLKVDASAKLVQ